MKIIQTGAVQLDADVCNNIDTPAQGCHAGDGIHVTIPADWLTRILAGQDVFGCNYARLRADGSLIVSDNAIGRLGIPAIVNALSAPLKAQAALLQVKLNTAANI